MREQEAEKRLNANLSMLADAERMLNNSEFKSWDEIPEWYKTLMQYSAQITEMLDTGEIPNEYMRVVRTVVDIVTENRKRDQ